MNDQLPPVSAEIKQHVIDYLIRLADQTDNLKIGFLFGYLAATMADEPRFWLAIEIFMAADMEPQKVQAPSRPRRHEQEPKNQ